MNEQFYMHLHTNDYVYKIIEREMNREEKETEEEKKKNTNNVRWCFCCRIQFNRINSVIYTMKYMRFMNTHTSTLGLNI